MKQLFLYCMVICSAIYAGNFVVNSTYDNGLMALFAVSVCVVVLANDNDIKDIKLQLNGLFGGLVMISKEVTDIIDKMSKLLSDNERLLEVVEKITKEDKNGS